MGVTQAAGLSLKWFRDNFCIEEKGQPSYGIDPYVLMDKEAEKRAGKRRNIIPSLSYGRADTSP